MDVKSKTKIGTSAVPTNEKGFAVVQTEETAGVIASSNGDHVGMLGSKEPVP